MANTSSFAPVIARTVHLSTKSESPIDAIRHFMDLMQTKRITTIQIRQTGIVQILRTGEARFIDYIQLGELLPGNKDFPPHTEIEEWFLYYGIPVEIKGDIIPAPPRPAHKKLKTRSWFDK